ncbi:hypothetical protein [Xanthobacter versatilis]|uniref:hypothetical protein n=1 Tax=Xanthobacter autotrophicus (strain ATCC BAA-1158 / Py2) TaxID=78245 RepID=UPI003726B53C
MSMFHVGQQVICIDDNWGSDGHNIPIDAPKKGMVYSVREVIFNVPFPSGHFFDLEEVRCGLWDAEQFRPVKPTSIEVFRQLLSPIHERETV